MMCRYAFCVKNDHIPNHIKICQLFEDFLNFYLFYFCVISYNFVVYAMYITHHLHVVNYF